MLEQGLSLGGDVYPQQDAYQVRSVSGVGLVVVILEIAFVGSEKICK